jgi:RNA polymerase sigma-70 factor (ECF subfamily)
MAATASSSPPTADAPAGVVGIEQALVGRVRAGDGAAFRQIFERHAGRVHRFLLDLLRDPAAADEATQETFVRAHRQLPTLRAAERLAPWLLGIARYVALEAQRGRRRLAPTGDDAVAALPDTAPTPEAALLGAESEHLLQGALGRLSPERRAALLLRLDHGLAYEEIATAMGWSLPKVKNEIHRARLELRAHLSSYVGGTR